MPCDPTHNQFTRSLDRIPELLVYSQIPFKPPELQQKTKMIVRQNLTKVDPPTSQQPLPNLPNDCLLQNEPITKTKSYCVYRVKKADNCEQLAIKVFSAGIQPKSESSARLSEQLSCLKQMSHQHVVKCLDCYLEAGRWHLVSEHCNQADLRSLLNQRPQLPELTAKHFIIHILQGLIYLQQHALTPKHLTPSHIFLHNGQAKVSPFASAELFDADSEDVEQEATCYMSPQRYFLQSDEPKAVIWSLGVIMYEMAHGKPLFACTTESQRALQLMQQLDPTICAAHLSPQFKHLLLRCLSVDPEKRPTLLQLAAHKYFAETQTVASFDKHTCWQGLQQELQQPPTEAPHRQKHQRQTDENQTDGGYTIKVFLSGNNQPNQTYPPPTQLQSTLERKIKLLSALKAPTPQTLTFPLSEALTLKLINYCRLVYKSSQLIGRLQIKDEKQLAVMQTWVLLVLESLVKQSQESSTPPLRQASKTCNLLEGYYQKYTSQFGNLDRSKPISFKQIASYFQTMRDKLLQLRHPTSTEKLLLAHYILVVSHATQLLSHCYLHKDYAAFEKTSLLDRVLAMGVQGVSARSLELLAKQCLA